MSATTLYARARGWPRGLTAQLLCLLVGGLLLSHGVGVWLLSGKQGDMHPLARNKTTDLFVRVFNGVEALKPLDAMAVLRAASDERGTFSIVDRPAPATDDDDSQVAARGLQQRLDKPASAVRTCLGDDCVNGTKTRADARPLMPMVLQVQRDDGQWLQAILWAETRTRWWWPVSFWLQASLLPIFLAVGLAVRNVTRPGRALVDAAGRVSRGERVEPLPIEGPREMREILQAFNQMQSRISRFVEDRTRMLGAISHDFRTPLTSLRLRVEMVDDAALRVPMVRTLDDMRGMVDETLRFARDDAAVEPTLSVDLRGLLDEMILEQQQLGHDVGWSQAPTDVVTRAYRCRPLALRRAVGNLIDNAVRYGQRARISLKWPATEVVGEAVDAANMVMVDIDDNGPGIAPEDIDAAFTPFVRLPQGARADGDTAQNTGLGLAIARSCARAHGGDVMLQTLPGGHGLRARLSLPA